MAVHVAPGAAAPARQRTAARRDGHGSRAGLGGWTLALAGGRVLCRAAEGPIALLGRAEAARPSCVPADPSAGCPMAFSALTMAFSIRVGERGYSFLVEATASGGRAELGGQPRVRSGGRFRLERRRGGAGSAQRAALVAESGGRAERGSGDPVRSSGRCGLTSRRCSVGGAVGSGLDGVRRPSRPRELSPVKFRPAVRAEVRPGPSAAVPLA